MTIVEPSRLLASPKITRRQLVEQSLAAIKDPQRDGARALLLVHDSESLAKSFQWFIDLTQGLKGLSVTLVPPGLKRQDSWSALLSDSAPQQRTSSNREINTAAEGFKMDRTQV